MPSAASTASKELVNWPARSLTRNLTVAGRWSRSISVIFEDDEPEDPPAIGGATGGADITHAGSRHPIRDGG